ncbi:hypothetical protein acdb102_09520 [Acidothermaceae bacterium B102]|nr:hypothetical protein acdb102_09520 [Acidothermaceae bacterium B102]
MKLSEAIVQAWHHQRETAPRRALVKEAFDATRRLPGIRDAPAGEIRPALLQALAARGIHDFSERSLDPMVRAIQTSRTSVLADYALTGVQKTREAVAWLKEHEVPAWLNPPRHAVPLDASSAVERALGQIDLDPRDLDLLARLFADAPVPIHLPEEVDGLEPRFPCWLNLEDADDPASKVIVHVGKHTLGRLKSEAAAATRPALKQLARRGKALLASAELRGSTPATVRIEVRLMVSS